MVQSAVMSPCRLTTAWHALGSRLGLGPAATVSTFTTVPKDPGNPPIVTEGLGGFFFASFFFASFFAPFGFPCPPENVFAGTTW